MQLFWFILDGLAIVMLLAIVWVFGQGAIEFMMYNLNQGLDWWFGIAFGPLFCLAVIATASIRALWKDMLK